MLTYESWFDLIVWRFSVLQFYSWQCDGICKRSHEGITLWHGKVIFINFFETAKAKAKFGMTNGLVQQHSFSTTISSKIHCWPLKTKMFNNINGGHSNVNSTGFTLWIFLSVNVIVTVIVIDMTISTSIISKTIEWTLQQVTENLKRPLKVKIINTSPKCIFGKCTWLTHLLSFSSLLMIMIYTLFSWWDCCVLLLFRGLALVNLVLGAGIAIRGCYLNLNSKLCSLVDLV